MVVLLATITVCATGFLVATAWPLSLGAAVASAACVIGEVAALVALLALIGWRLVAVSRRRSARREVRAPLIGLATALVIAVATVALATTSTPHRLAFALERASIEQQLAAGECPREIVGANVISCSIDASPDGAGAAGDAGARISVEGGAVRAEYVRVGGVDSGEDGGASPAVEGEQVRPLGDGWYLVTREW